MNLGTQDAPSGPRDTQVNYNEKRTCTQLQLTRCGASWAKTETFFSDLFLPQNRAQRPTGVTHVTTAPTMRDGNRCIIDFEPHGLAVHAKIDLHE